MSNRIMVDIETLGTTANSAITSIGAARFDKEEVLDKFYVVIKFDNSRFIDADTIRWWMKQKDEARKVFLDGNYFPLADALAAFDTWMGDATEIWGNGSDFDNVILMDAYKQHNMTWNHRVNRCYRTLKSLMPGIEIKRIGTYHNAVDDATSQAEHLIEIMKALKL